MKRRTFLSTITALIAAPALPAGAVGANAGVAQHFVRAKLLARCHDRASPEMFARLMRLDNETAQGVYTMLKERSVITSGSDGITRALNPLNTNCVPNEARKARDFARMSSELRKKLRKLRARTQNETSQSEQEPPENQANSAESLKNERADEDGNKVAVNDARTIG